MNNWVFPDAAVDQLSSATPLAVADKSKLSLLDLFMGCLLYTSVLEAQRAEMAGKTAADCGLPTISILTPLYNTDVYKRQIFSSLKRFDKPGTWSYIVSAMSAPFLNTVFFMGWIVLGEEE